MSGAAPTPPGRGASGVRLDRLVVHAPGDAATGARIAERLPATLERAVKTAGLLDARAVRVLIERATREAWR